MKRILIMIMSCRQDFFVKQENDCRNTYLSNLPDNFDYIIYRGGYEYDEYSESQHLLLLTEPDDLNNTFKKTYRAFTYLPSLNIKEYDYIFRTNTSTYINIPLLNAFVQSLPDNDDNIYSGEIIFDCKQDKTTDYLYCRGNSLLINRKQEEIILNDGRLLYMFRNLLVDDNAIGAIFANHYSKISDKYYEHIKCFTEGWYKSLPKDNNYSEHQVCRMNNDNIDFDFLKKMVVIQIKSHIDRNIEHANYNIIHQVFSENTDININNTVNYLYEYMENPDVFIGDCYGYRQYKDVL